MFNFELYRQISASLTPTFGRQEANAMARWILEEMDNAADANPGTNVNEIVDRLLQHEPLQYIFGHTDWRGLRLEVTPATLIPRPETSELIDAVNAFFLRGQNPLEESSSPKPIRLLDIGTGSGCIAIALKKEHPDWEVHACDISEEALSVAQQNAQTNAADILFHHLDILQGALPGCYDIIVSNPPYICEEEQSSMAPNVLQHEPATALFVPNTDPLLFYRRIAQLVRQNAGNACLLAFEINERFGPATCQMLEDEGFTHIQLIQDICGKNRIVMAKNL